MENREKFFAAHAKRELNDAEKVTVLKLMELQRHAMLMYTSCGWFFDELSGIETVQVIQYAARVLQLGMELFGKDFEPAFLERLQSAKSNIPENGDGRMVYEKFVRPARIDWPKAVAHYAISSLFQEFGKATRVFSFTFQDEKKRQVYSTGKMKLAIGSVRVVSEITQESDRMGYAILYLGEHNLIGGVGRFDSDEAYDTMARELGGAFEIADVPLIIRQIDQHFGHSSYSLKSLFKDEQRRILNEILASAREDLENRFRLITERYAPMMKFLQGAGAPLPAGLQTAWDLTLHGEIRKQLSNGHTDANQLRHLINEASGRGSEVLNADISYAVKSRLENMIKQLEKNPGDLDRIRELKELAGLLIPLPIGLNLAEVQNTFWALRQKLLPELRRVAAESNGEASGRLNEFLALGGQLGFAPSALE